MTLPLTPAQLDRFRTEGYLVAENVFADADLQPVIDELHAEVGRRARELLAQGKLSQTFEDAGFERQLALISAETDALALGIWNGALSGPAIFDLIRHPRLLDIAEQFCGPELIASSVYRLRPKVPRHVLGPVPWHQDSGYLESHCDAGLILTVWVPFVDATEENGCMWVVPRVHRGGRVLPHAHRRYKPYLIIPEDELRADPALRPLPVPVRKGGVLLLHNLTPHASFENGTDAVRWSMDLRYQSAALPTNAAITRLPGESVPSEAEGVPAVPVACYPPEADFLVRSKLRPSEVVADPAAFHRIRQGHVVRPVSRKWTETVEA